MVDIALIFIYFNFLFTLFFLSILTTPLLKPHIPHNSSAPQTMAQQLKRHRTLIHITCKLNCRLEFQSRF
jgi:hypothetical protein